MKTCKRCGAAKPLDQFHRHGTTKDGRATDCKECKCQRSRDWYASNTQRASDRSAAYYRRNSDVIKAATRAWRQANAEWKKNYDTEYSKTEHYIDYQATYQRVNRTRLRAQYREKYANDAEYRLQRKLNAAVRRARKALIPAHPFTAAQLHAKLIFWNNCCWVCGDTATEIDHVKPIAAGGAHMLCNLRPICPRCNRKKRDKWPLPARAKILGFCR